MQKRQRFEVGNSSDYTTDKIDGKKIIAHNLRHNFCSCERKPEKKIRLVRDSNPMTSAIPVQRSNQQS